jgi:hypothetical protein
MKPLFGPLPDGRSLFWVSGIESAKLAKRRRIFATSAKSLIGSLG